MAFGLQVIPPATLVTLSDYVSLLFKHDEITCDDENGNGLGFCQVYIYIKDHSQRPVPRTIIVDDYSEVGSGVRKARYYRWVRIL